MPRPQYHFCQLSKFKVLPLSWCLAQATTGRIPIIAGCEAVPSKIDSMSECLATVATRALKCQTLGCAVCRNLADSERMHTVPSGVLYSGTEVVLNRPRYFYATTYTVA